MVLKDLKDVFPYDIFVCVLTKKDEENVTLASGYWGAVRSNRSIERMKVKTIQPSRFGGDGVCRIWVKK